MPILLLLLTLLTLPLPAQTRTPVLVELFTSEGCSSCPPADALLARLDHDQPIPGAQIIVLEEHVDYWDSLGWRDRFSSPEMTERQRQYARRFHLDDIYTPQMVVAGATQFVGSDARAAAKAVVVASQAKLPPLSLTVLSLSRKYVSATVAFLPQTGRQIEGDVYAALVTPTESTHVRSGENGGRTLNHVGVVRSLTRIGAASALEHDGVHFELTDEHIAQGTRLIVFAQAPQNGPIFGATVLDLPPAMEKPVSPIKPAV